MPPSRHGRDRFRAALQGRGALKPGRSVGGGDAEGFHFAVEVGALEANGTGGLRHVPVIFLQFAEDEFALVGAAGFVQR